MLGDSTWYAALNKPAFNPPNWIFGPVWTLLYLMMGIAAFLVWDKGFGKKEVKSALLVFALQLILNIAWSFVFFGQHLLLLSVINIVVLWLFIILTMVKFAKISPLASWLLLPYLLWVSFASVLNTTIWLLNR